MHPELFMILYRQQELEREQGRRYRLAALERDSVAAGRGRPTLVTGAFRVLEQLRELTRISAPEACCAAA